MKNNRARKKPIHRIVSVATAAIMATSLMPLNEMWKGAEFLSAQIAAFAEGEVPVTVNKTINTAKEFVEYSNIWNTENDEYKTNGEFDSAKYNAAVAAHANDVVELAFSSGSTLEQFTNEENGTFCSIGSESYPFTGIILINTGAIGTLNLEKPLFNYLGDSAKILSKGDTISGESTYTFLPSTLQPFEVTISRTEDDTGLPILANYVVPTLAEGETAREWIVKIDSFSGNSYSYGGIIGTVKSQASPCISVVYNADTSKVWKGSGNVGRIVCDMEASSTLMVKSLTGNAGIEVTTDNGSAGGIAGTMETGSKIILKDSHTNTASVITASGSADSVGYAGGLAGYCNGGTIEIDENTASYSIAHTLTGTAGAGGIFGKYVTAGGALDLTKYSMNCTLSSSGNVGGVFGELHNTAIFTLKGSDSGETRNLLQSSHTETKAANYGGLIGMYQAGKLADSLIIKDISTSPANSGTSDYYGGAVGKINGVAYAELDNFWAGNCANPSTATFGGVVGCADEAFVQAKDITISTSSSAAYTGGGVVGHMEKGVLQLIGTTDLSGTTPTVGNTNGQILGYRDSALVFASLDANNNGWQLIRGTVAPVDDIGTWGEVVRFSSTFSQDDVLTIADHQVTLADASGTISASDSVSAEEAFARFALNNQIRTSSGVLVVGTNADSLHQTNITMGTVDLTDTGIIGLTRDGSDKYLDYQGTISGGSVTLAIGQAYGLRISGENTVNVTISEEGSGQIYRHQYLGLVGKTSGATIISGITLQGSIYADAKEDDYYYVGMGVGKAESNITVDGVTVSSSSAVINVDGNAKSRVGGLIGQFDGSTVANGRKLYIGQTTACSFGATISGGSADTGGVIGKISKGYVTQTVEGKDTSVETDGAFDASIGNTTVTGSVTGTGAVGGLIASIVSSTQKQDRDLILTDVATGALTVENGSLLGDTWYDTEVQLGTSNTNGVTIGTSSDASTVKGSGAMAGLVNHATGQWIVNDVNITNLAVDSGSVDSFGVMVNKGYKTDSTNSALFMWLKNGYDYSITNITGSALDGAPVFDELVAYSASGDVTANGQGIVSIYTASTNGSLNMSGTANTYTGQTTWGQKANSHTRYYYNLDSLVRASYNVTDTISSGLTAPQKLLAWSIQQYAHSSLRAYFAVPYSDNKIGTATGTLDVFDMTGLSYYPVNIDSGKSVTLNGKVTLYNEEIENVVAASDKNRSTLNPTQHYLMHNGIFNDVKGTLTVGTLELNGTVGRLETGLNSATGSGALICGKLGGSRQAKANFIMSTSGQIQLNGVKVHNIDSYSPLLINKISTYTVANVNGVSTSSGAYSNGFQAATSLIGYVGSTDATEIQLDFSDIRLDARKTNSGLKTYSSEEITATLNALNEAQAALETAEALALADAVETGNATEEQAAAYQALVDAKNAAQAEYDKRNALSAASTALDTANTEFQTAKAAFETAIGIVAGDTEEQIETKYATFLAGHEAGTASPEQETAYTAFLTAQNAQADAQTVYHQANACSDLDTAYNTTSSIFTRATLLEKLSYDPNFKGSVSSTYNYASTEDWDASGSHIAHVTYGAEISMGPLTDPVMIPGSMYDEMEYSYSDGDAYTNPTAANGGKYTLFHTHFIPYVAQHYDNADDKRQYQVKVNHHLTAFTGCGTYNDPYILSTGATGGEQLKSIANILNGGSPGDLCIGYSSGTWCSGTKNTTNPEQTSHKWYKWEGNFPNGNYVEYVWSATGGDDGTGGLIKKETNGSTLTQDAMREHLAKAYYQLEGEVEINDEPDNTADDYIGLGVSEDTTGVFRGVIDGQKNSIINHSSSPLIVSSYGCVVKDLSIEVEREDDITLKQTESQTFNKDSTGCQSYGAVIAKVMGGDNILDNVGVSFSFSEGKKIAVEDAKAQLVPVGGYIGVVVNGGVYFRNMARVEEGTNNAISYGLTNSSVKGFVGTPKNNSTWDTNLVSDSTTKWLYVNPVIGRVINGFAVTESDAYRPFENGSRSRIYVKENAQAADPSNTADYSAIVTNEEHIKYNESVTMQNGTKNYSITDISPDLADLEVSSTYAIAPKNAQSFFLMSLMVNSGMSYNNASSIGYYAANMMSRNLAAYNSIGTNVASSASCEDYNSYAQYDGTGTGKPGYLIKQYSDSENAKSMANQSAATVTLTKQDYVLPDSFRGIGNFFQNDSNNNYKLKITTFTGNGSTILMNTCFRYYVIDYYNKDVSSAYRPWANTENVGLGLFNYQPQSGTYTDFILSGTLKTDIIKENSSSSVDYTTSCNANGYLNVGMLFGVTDVTQTIDSVALQDVDVFGIRHTGGLIGDFPGDTNKTIIINNTQSYDSMNVKIQGANTVGGMIGSSRQGTLNINYNNNTFGISEIKSLSTSNTSSGNVYTYGVGGLVGVWRGGKGAGNPANISNITIQSSNTEKDAKIDGGANFNCGGIIGTQNRAPLNLDNCNIINISCYANGKQSDGNKKYDNGLCGGIVGYTTSYSMITIENTHLSTDTSPKAEISNTGMNSGGFIGGSGNGDDEAGFIIKNSSIQKYTISGTEKVGGIVGGRSFRSDKSDTNTTYDRNFTLQNVKISECTIKGNNYVGSILGYLDWYELRGYNIQCNKVTFSPYTATSISNLGYVVGYVSEVPPTQRSNKSGYKAVKLVGFTRQNVAEVGSEHLVGNDTFGTDSSGNAGYVIFADYNGKSLNPTNNTKGSYTKTNVTYDADDVATSTDNTVQVSYNTFTEDFLNGTNVTNQKTVTYSIPKIDTTTNKIMRNNKGEIIYEVKTYSYGDNWPNVTSSPVYVLNPDYSNVSGKTGITAQHFLTGDGISSLRYSASAINNTPDSVPKSIINDITNSAPKAYLNTGLIRVENSQTIDELTPLNTTLGTDKKYSTFKTEIGTRANVISRDFPVLVIDDIDSSKTNAFICNYLKLLTNSNLDYSTDKAGVFTIKTAKCTYDNGKFIPDYNNCNLNYLSGKGFSISNRYDNEEEDENKNKLLVFSLIDVEFYDPSDSTKVAYHLYVPTIVKKLLQFNFEATTLSGSSYQISPEYTGNRKNTLLENFGNPVTLEYRYTYKRELKDWREAILAGENILFSFSKDVLMVSATVDPTTHLKDAPGPMKMILIDPNKYSDGTKQNRTFYADNTADNQTCIVAGDSNYHLQLTGFSSNNTSFSPKLLNDFLIVTATAVNGTGNFTEATGSHIGTTYIPSDATVRAVCGGTTVYLKPSENNTGNYQISSAEEDHSVVYADGRNGETDLLYEDYYVTFLTERPDPTVKKYNAVASENGNYVESYEGEDGAFEARTSSGAIWLKEKEAGETGTHNIEKLYHYSFESMRQLTATAPDGLARSYPTQSVQPKESHLYIGDLYNNRLTISTNHADPDHPNISDEITMASPELDVHLTANVSLTSTASSVLGNTVQENDAISVYESLLYTYNWNKTGENSKLGILSANELEMLSYTVTGNQIINGDVTSKFSKTDAENRAKYLDETNKNHVEMKNLVNIAKGLSSGVTIDAQFKLTYSEKSDLITQFAERINDSDTSGTYVIGYSNISSSKNETANSAMSQSIDGTAKYYSTEDNMASLQYDAVGKYDDDFGDLGINANDLEEAEQVSGKTKIETVAYYSLDNWSSIKTPQKIRLKFELFDKVHSYGTALDIPNYLPDFKVYTSKDTDLDGSESACTVDQSNKKMYTYTVDLSEAGYQLLDYNEGLESYTFYVDYTVYTGKKSGVSNWFENLERMYQNYMVKLTVELLDDEGAVLPGSSRDNHIIYTNARIYPNIIDTDS